LPLLYHQQKISLASWASGAQGAQDAKKVNWQLGRLGVAPGVAWCPRHTSQPLWFALTRTLSVLIRPWLLPCRLAPSCAQPFPHNSLSCLMYPPCHSLRLSILLPNSIWFITRSP
jgi:hypothetical protein